MNYYQLIADNFQSTIETIAMSADTLADAIERGSQLMSTCLIGDHKIIACGNGVDAVLALLRGLDAAVTMRFHASVFALSQQVPAIGIDYQVGGIGKVGELFTAHSGGEALSIQDLTPGRLTERLLHIAGTPVASGRESTGRP